MTVIRSFATIYGLLCFAILAIALVLFGLVWLVRRWRELKTEPRRGIAPPARESDQRDYADETDLVPEGLGIERGPGPWITSIDVDAIKRANPKLPDIQVCAVAVARSRLRAAR